MWNLEQIAERIYSGHRVNRITVRDLLQMFGAERRGYWITSTIKERLRKLRIRTEPDFETVWIGSYIRFVPTETVEYHVVSDDDVDRTVEQESAGEPEPLLAPDFANGIASSGPASATGQSQAEEAKASPEISDQALNPISFTDHTFRLGQLPSSNTPLIAVNENDPLLIAVTKMRQHDYSQLPVMQGARTVRGMISWKTIGARPLINHLTTHVGDVMEKPLIFDSDDPLFSVTDAINASGYALVRNRKDATITGIVTPSDLASHFQQLTLPFLLLREVELHIREMLQGRVTETELREVTSAVINPRPVSEVDKLSFGQYLALLGRTDIWSKLTMPVDQKCVVDQLDDVRKIRNEVMHFDPDPMSQEDLSTLHNAAKFLRELLGDIRN